MPTNIDDMQIFEITGKTVDYYAILPSSTNEGVHNARKETVRRTKSLNCNIFVGDDSVYYMVPKGFIGTPESYCSYDKWDSIHVQCINNTYRAVRIKEGKIVYNPRNENFEIMPEVFAKISSF